MAYGMERLLTRLVDNECSDTHMQTRRKKSVTNDLLSKNTQPIS